jgi:hypothetical protein
VDCILVNQAPGILIITPCSDHTQQYSHAYKSSSYARFTPHDHGDVGAVSSTHVSSGVCARPITGLYIFVVQFDQRVVKVCSAQA